MIQWLLNPVYRRPKFLEILLAIREEMAREADYDPDLFAEMVRAGLQPAVIESYELTDSNNGQSDNREAGTPEKKRRVSKRGS
jgi:hypothetical protein